MSPVCFLLLLGAAAAVQAADSNPAPSPMFVDWLSQQSSSKAKSASYEEVESESVCLQETKERNCRCLNTFPPAPPAVPAPAVVCQREYSESTLACCNSHGPGSFMSEKPLMSVCNWVEDFFSATAVPGPIKYDGTTTEKVGIFTVTCEMREDAEKCGSPLCEGMSIVASGDILRYPKVAFVGAEKPDELAADTDCGLVHTPRLGGGQRSADQVQYVGSDEEAMFWVGSGDIYSGTFRVTSRYHASKYKVGQFQMAFPTKPDNLVAYDTLTDKAYVAKANQVNLEFLKTDAY